MPNDFLHDFSVDAARGLAGPDWLTTRRSAAAEEFASAPLPTPAAEEWRYSAIADFDLAAYRPVVTDQPPVTGSDASATLSVEASALFDCDVSEAAAVIDINDGRIVALQGAAELAEQGVHVGALADSPNGAELLGSVAALSADYFTLFNDAFMSSPSLVSVPAGVSVDGGIAIRHHHGSANTAGFPKSIARIGAHSSAHAPDDQRVARTYQDHAAADTTSNLLFKGAVGESARSVYTGLIRVRPEARGTNAVQTNRNLKLSEDAWAESVPNLEIENNEVRCAHASAVGPVDADQVFYLESRGVPTAVAERLIVAGFFDEVLEAFPVVSAADSARSAIALKLNQMLASAT